MIRTGKIDATKGSLIPMILTYAIPLMIATMVQKLFNAMDVAVLGHLGSSVAVASVGATSTIGHLLIDTFMGFSSGSKVILARHFGARNEKQIKKTSDTSILLSLIIGFTVAILGVIFGPKLLELTNCPENCMEGAVLYLRIYVCGAPVIMLYNAASSIITASGDSRRPLYYIIFSGFVNLVLNVILCFILPQKVIAVAVATVVSQLIAALLACRRLAAMDGLGHVDFKKMRWDSPSFGNLLRYGVPGNHRDKDDA
jgi:putative MATE family efflux protein